MYRRTETQRASRLCHTAPYITGAPTSLPPDASMSTCTYRTRVTVQLQELFRILAKIILIFHCKHWDQVWPQYVTSCTHSLPVKMLFCIWETKLSCAPSPMPWGRPPRGAVLIRVPSGALKPSEQSRQDPGGSEKPCEAFPLSSHPHLHLFLGFSLWKYPTHRVSKKPSQPLQSERLYFIRIV